jgi:photosystem II stability/assembly factor-like uncharacterized protein
MKIYKIILVILLIALNSSFAQQIFWKHLNGPMGGIIGDLGFTSNGDIYAGAYPSWQVYSGLFKSTDNGNSWEKIVTPFNDFEVYTIYITKEDHIWVGTNFQDRIYLSTDNGQSWEIKRNGYLTGECWAFGQSKDGVMFAGDGQYQNTFRSTNYGDTWEFSAPLRPLVFATDSNNIVFAGTHDGLFATTDNGLSWAQNNFLSNIAVSSILIDSSNNIYCSTGYYSDGNGVFFSSDGGQNWTNLGLAGKVILSLAFDSQGNLFAGSDNDGIFKTTDMGNTWTNYQGGLFRKNIFRLRINNDDDIFVGSENEGVFRSTDGGNNFEQVGLPTSKVNNVVFSGDSLIFTSTPSGVQKYNRQSQLWTNLGLHQVEAVSITPGNKLYAATLDGLYESFDLGNTWSLNNFFSDTTIAVYNVLVVNNDTVFCATLQNLLRSTNKGLSWFSTGIKTDFWARDLFFKDTVLWVRGADTEYNLYRSTDFGSSFTIAFLGIDHLMSLNSISQISNGFVFLTNPNIQQGLFRSTDLGQSWSQLLFNKYPAAVYADDFGKVISGWDSVYVSFDYGDSWSILPHPFGDVNYFTDIKADEYGRLYCATYRTGMFEFTIITSIDDPIEPVIDYDLTQNFPNPFNPSTTIRYQIPQDGIVTLKIYDILGSEVVTLVNEEKVAGKYEVNFNASNFSSGVYFYTIKAGSFMQTRKMLLMK